MIWVGINYNARVLITQKRIVYFIVLTLAEKRGAEWNNGVEWFSKTCHPLVTWSCIPGPLQSADTCCGLMPSHLIKI